MDLRDALKEYARGTPQLAAPIEPEPRAPEENAAAPAPEPARKADPATAAEISVAEAQTAGEARTVDPQPLLATIRPTASPVDLVDGVDAPYEWPHPFHYISGAAGSGKTWLTRERYHQSPQGSVVMMCSTGIAAVNLGDAVTINSQLGYFDTESMEQNFSHDVLQQRLRRLRQAGVRRLILDEVSMFEARQLTCLVRALNQINSEAGASKQSQHYFGDQAPSHEIGLTLVGDFLQLPPIGTREKGKKDHTAGLYAFQSPEWHYFESGIETLTEIRRQGNEDFIRALRACRAEQADLVCDYFRRFIYPVQDMDFPGTTIVAKNAAVDRMNQLRLDRLPGTPDQYLNQRRGKERGEWKHIPIQLLLKPNAAVMILSNRYEDTGGGREIVYANGDHATYLGKSQSGDAMVQLTRTGEAVPVKWITRENKKPRQDARYVCSNQQCGHEALSGHVKRCVVCGATIKKDLYEVVGEITYMPLRLAYASTVHKTQGLTLEQVQIVLTDPFFVSYGMTYVALSRARGPEGLRLIGTVDQLRARVKMDPAVSRWR